MAPGGEIYLATIMVVALPLALLAFFIALIVLVRHAIGTGHALIVSALTTVGLALLFARIWYESLMLLFPISG